MDRGGSLDACGARNWIGFAVEGSSGMRRRTGEQGVLFLQISRRDPLPALACLLVVGAAARQHVEFFEFGRKSAPARIRTSVSVYSLNPPLFLLLCSSSSFLNLIFEAQLSLNFA
jgi:hypothetical protein